MKSFTEVLKRHSLLIGLFLMFLFTWPIDLASSGILPIQFPYVVYLFLGWGFVFAAVIMTWLTLGKDAMVTLLKRFLIWRVNWKWYLTAILLLPALQFSSVLLTAWLTGVPADYANPMIRKVVPLSAPLLVLAALWIIFEVLTNGEEMGWRGYVLPRLQARYTPLVASLIVGVIWSVWKLPRFLGRGVYVGRSFFWLTILFMGEAVLYTWLYNSSRGSLLLVTLFHATNNTAGMFLPIAYAIHGGIAQNMMAVMYIIAAVVVTIIAGPARLSRTEPKQVQELSHEQASKPVYQV